MPAKTPVTMPVKDPTVAISGLLLLHTPPAVGSVSNIVEPTHTVDGPEIIPGYGLTVIVLVATQVPIE